MKAAKDDIIQTLRAHHRYSLSIAQKENDSGIFFNERIIFLLPDHHIGYISQVKMEEAPQKINFQKSKYTILISNLKKIIIKQNTLSIKYEHLSQNKKVDKFWLLRFNSQVLTRKWYDKINKEIKALQIKSKAQSSASKAIYKSQTKVILSQNKPKLTIQTNDQAKISLYDQSYPPKEHSKQKNLSINRSLSYSRIAKPEKTVREVGTVITPKNQKNAETIQNQPNNLPILRNDLLQSKKAENSNEIIKQTDKKKKEQQKINQQKQQIILNQIRQSQRKQVEQYKKKIIESKQRQRLSILNQNQRLQDQANTKRQLYDQHNKRKQLQAEQAQRKQLQAEKTYRKQLQVSIIPKKHIQSQNNKGSYNEASNSQRKQQYNQNNKRRQLQQSRIYIQMINQTHSKIMLHDQSSNRLQNQQMHRVKQQEQRLQQQRQRIIQKQRQRQLTNQRQRQKQILKSKQQQKQRERQRQIYVKIMRQEQNKATFQKSNHNKNNKNQLRQSKINPIQFKEQPKVYILDQNKIISPNKADPNQNLAYLIQKNKMLKMKKQIAENPYWKDIPWTYKYIKYDYLIFEEFQSCAEQLMKEAIHRYINNIGIQNNLASQGIFRYKKRDLQVKIALIQLIQINDPFKKQKSVLCNKRNARIIENQFKNYEYLYNILGNGRLKVPLIHLCEINGFIGLIKANCEYQTSYPYPEVQPQLQQLADHFKYQNDLQQYFTKHAFPLNQSYYQKFQHTTKEEEEKAPFTYYFIDNIQPLFLYDHIIQNNSDQYFRKQLAFVDKGQNQNLEKIPISKTKKNKNEKSAQKSSEEVQKISKHLLKSIADVVIQMQNLQVFFFNSQQFSEYLHGKGINIRYLGYIYDQLTLDFQRKFILSQIAARSCKNLHRKTFQDQMIEFKGADEHTLLKLCDFFNCITGKGPETIQLWKVICNQSKYSFGVQVNIEAICKHHFAISLIENCRLNVNWQKVNHQSIFKQEDFFSRQNFLGLRTHHKRYKPYYSQCYLKYSSVSQQKSKQGIESLIQQLNLAQSTIPEHLNDYSLSIKTLLTSVISPPQQYKTYPHLHIYSYSRPQKPTRSYFQIILNHIRWSLKLEQKYQYIRACDLFIKLSTQFYGDFHPSFSELYEIFSAYHLGKSEYEDAIVFAKSSLVNIVKLSGNNHSKTAQCYYHLALCYIKINKRQEAIFALIKAKSIYEHNNQTKYIPYGKLCLKLALLYLSQHQIPQSIQQITKSLDIFSIYLGQQSVDCEDQVVQSYQMLYRCFQLTEDKQQIALLSSQCYSKLKYITKISNLEIALKIYLFPKILSIQSQSVTHYHNFINLLSSISYRHKATTNAGLEHLKARIEQDRLQQSLKIYLSQLKIILQHIEQRNILNDWHSFKNIHERQTVNDFIALHQQMLAFLGQAYVLNILQEIH